MFKDKVTISGFVIVDCGSYCFNKTAGIIDFYDNMNWGSQLWRVWSTVEDPVAMSFCGA